MRGGPDLDLLEQSPETAAHEAMEPEAQTFGRRQTPPEPPVVTGPPERWRVPVEMALYQANATSLMFLRRWRGMGARFAPSAEVWRVGRRLVARIDFMTPVGPEKQNGLVVQLSVHLWENEA